MASSEITEVERMETLIVLGGGLLFFALLMVSIALHELGHLSFAKLFGVRVPQYMVGFGPTAWSRRKGETEYGIKWFPLGGYIRMIGMLPPAKGDTSGKARTMRTGPFQGLIDSARGAALEEVRPGDEDRVFYGKKWWQKLLIMLAGPAANLVIAFLLFMILIMGIGISTQQPVVSTVAKCVVPITQTERECTAKDPLTPANTVGLKPGDRFVSFAGQRIESYRQLQRLIRSNPGKAVPAVIKRDGREMAITIPLTSNKLGSLTKQDSYETVGYLGITPLLARERQGLGTVVTTMTDMTTRTANLFVHLPEKMVGIWKTAIGQQERDPEGPVSVVGASRVGGEFLASENPLTDKVVMYISLLASVNFAVGMFNLIPLLPLDGGHMAGALWEAIKRGLAKMFRRPDPGYVDIAKALPLTYVVASIFLVMGALLIYVDVFDPIKLTG